MLGIMFCVRLDVFFKMLEGREGRLGNEGRVGRFGRLCKES